MRAVGHAAWAYSGEFRGWENRDCGFGGIFCEPIWGGKRGSAGEGSKCYAGRVVAVKQPAWIRFGTKASKSPVEKPNEAWGVGVEKSSGSAIFGYPSRSAQVAKNRGRWNAIWEQLGKQGGIRLRVEWVMVLARWPMLGGVS